MSHRTQSLPPLARPLYVIRELRYHEASRQSIGLMLSVLFVVTARPVPLVLYSATVILIVGVAIRLWASGFIMKNKELATNGPYALVRHPLYVGNILVIFAFAAASGLWWTFLVVIAFLGFYYPTAIEYEDRKLATIFGDAWREYSKRTPALLPALRNRDRDTAGQWSFRKSLSNNLELVVTVFLLTCFFYNYTRL